MFPIDNPDNVSRTACDESKHSCVANSMIHLRLHESPALIYNGDLCGNQELQAMLTLVVIQKNKTRPI